MKNIPTVRWAGSHPTSTRANGHNTTNNNQQPSKHPVHKTRPDQPRGLRGLVGQRVDAPSEARGADGGRAGYAAAGDQAGYLEALHIRIGNHDPDR